MEGTSPERLGSAYELSIEDLLEVCEPLGSVHTEFIAGLELDAALGYVYGELLSEGGDPDEFFELAGIVELELETE